MRPTTSYTFVRLMTAERNVCCSPVPPTMHFHPRFSYIQFGGKLYTLTSATIRAKSSNPTPRFTFLRMQFTPHLNFIQLTAPPLFKFRLPHRNSQNVRCCIPSVIQLKVACVRYNAISHLKRYHVSSVATYHLLPRILCCHVSSVTTDLLSNTLLNLSFDPPPKKVGNLKLFNLFVTTILFFLNFRCWAVFFWNYNKC
jgi:hypothetical protein